MMSKELEKYKMLMMKKIDGEISPDEAQDLSQFLKMHPQYETELQTFEQLKKVRITKITN